MTIPQHTMTSGDVARVLGLSRERVRQLDAELQPVRRENGHRYYDPAAVQRLLVARATRHGEAGRE